MCLSMYHFSSSAVHGFKTEQAINIQLETLRTAGAVQNFKLDNGAPLPPVTFLSQRRQGISGLTSLLSESCGSGVKNVDLTTIDTSERIILADAISVLFEVFERFPSTNCPSDAFLEQLIDFSMVDLSVQRFIRHFQRAGVRLVFVVDNAEPDEKSQVKFQTKISRRVCTYFGISCASDRSICRSNRCERLPTISRLSMGRSARPSYRLHVSKPVCAKVNFSKGSFSAP